jgi:hypothetical protein
MKDLGLSEIEELRKRLNCREGLLIDFDYCAFLAGEKSASENSGRERGEGAPDGLKLASGSRTVSYF